MMIDPAVIVHTKKYPRSVHAMLDEMIAEHWHNAENLYCLGGLKFLVNSDIVLEQMQEAIVKQELLKFLKDDEQQIWLFAMFLNHLHR